MTTPPTLIMGSYGTLYLHLTPLNCKYKHDVYWTQLNSSRNAYPCVFNGLNCQYSSPTYCSHY